MQHIISSQEYLLGLGISSGLEDAQLDSLLEKMVPDKQDRTNLRIILANHKGNKLPTKEETLLVGRLVHSEYYDHRTTQDPRLFEAEVNLLSYHVKNRRNILSLGSGSGLLEGILAYNHPQTNFLATDISPEMLHEIREKRRKIGLRNLRTRKLDVTKLSRSRGDYGKFDFIFSIDNPGWFDEADFLLELRKKLVKDGELLIAATSYVHRDDHGYLDPKLLEETRKGGRCVNFLDARKMARESGMGFVTGYQEVKDATIPTFIFWKLFHNYVH